jgi:hypothetical protein
MQCTCFYVLHILDQRRCRAHVAQWLYSPAHIECTWLYVSHICSAHGITLHRALYFSGWKSLVCMDTENPLSDGRAVCMYVCMCVRMYTGKHVCMYVCMCDDTFVCDYVCVCVCVIVCQCVHVSSTHA